MFVNFKMLCVNQIKIRAMIFIQPLIYDPMQEENIGRF